MICMALKGYVANIEKLTQKNTDFRHVLYTGRHSQLVLMCLRPGEEIGMEVHEHIDQFFRFERGSGKVVIDGNLSDWDLSGAIFMFIDEASKETHQIRAAMMYRMITTVNARPIIDTPATPTAAF